MSTSIGDPSFSINPFMASIIENPNDDGPRLVYADYLDDNGDHERAEYIRLSCKLAREGEGAITVKAEHKCPRCGGRAVWRRGGYHFENMKRCVSQCGQPSWDFGEEVTIPGPLTRRREELERRHGERWHLEFWDKLPSDVRAGVYYEAGGRPCASWVDVTLHRGFLSHVEVEDRVLLAPGFAAALVRAAPVTEIRLRGLEPRKIPRSQEWAWWGDYPGGAGYTILPVEITGERWRESFNSYGEAIDAASRWSVDFCRAAAGLPAINWERINK